MADDFTRELSDLLPPSGEYGAPPAPYAAGVQLGGYAPLPLPPVVPPGAALQQSVGALGSMAPPELAIAAQQAQAVAQQQQMLLPNVSPGFNPIVAGYMDPAMNMTGAGMMTHANYGVFRQRDVPQYNTLAGVGNMGSGPVVPESIIPFVPYGATSALGFPTLERTRPDLEFRRGYDAQLDLASEYARVAQGRHADFVRDSGTMIASMGGALVGNVGGSIVGGAVGGGLFGSIVGGGIGTLAGGMAGFLPGVGEAASAAFRPAIERRADAIQAQFGSRQYLVGGADLDISGSGLSTTAAQRMMTQFDDIARSSRGRLNRQDVMQLSQVAGEQGLFDFAQNADQIASTVKQVTSLVATMSEITGDPDFRENIKKIGNLRQLGFSMSEMNVALQNADAFARMAGTDINTALQTSGLQGAQIFQGQGLDAATGLQTGMFSAGSANMAVQAGAFDEQTLALYGGKSGVAQQLTELSASFASGPMAGGMLPYAMKRGKDGALTVDTAALDRLRTGEISYDDAIREGARKFAGDKQAILEMSNRQRELTAQATRSLGPEGIQQMFLTQGQLLGKDLDGGLTEGLLAMGMNRDQANILTRMANSPTYFDNLRKQQEAEARRRGFDAAREQELEDSSGDLGFLDRMDRSIDNTFFGGAVNRHRRRRDAYLGQFSNPLDATQRWVSNRLAEAEEDTRLQAVGAKRFRGGNMTLSDAMLQNIDFDEVLSGRRPDAALTVGDGIGEDVFGTGGQARLEALAHNEGAFNRTLRGVLVESALLTTELTGDEAGSRWIRENERERQDSAKSVAQSYIAAGRVSSSGRALASANVTDLLTGGSTDKKTRARKYKTVRKVSQRLAELAKSKTSMFGTAEAITTAEFRQELRDAGMPATDVDKIMSDKQAMGQLIASSMNDMDGDTRAQVSELVKEIDSASQAQAGELYMQQTGTAAGKAFETLGDMGFSTTFGFHADSMSDYSEGERGLLQRYGEMESAEDVSALLMVAMEDAGEGSDLLKSDEANTEAFQERLAKARTLYGRLGEDEKTALLGTASSSIGGAKTVSELNARSKKLRGASQGIATAETLSQFRGAMDRAGVDLSDTTDIRQMMKEVNTLSSSERDKVGSDVLEAAERGDAKAFARAISRVQGVGSEGLTLDGRRVSDEGTQEQERLVRATTDMAARFAAASDANTSALERLTGVLEKRTPNEGALFQRTSLEG